jgi:hypothetical protein
VQIRQSSPLLDRRLIPQSVILDSYAAGKTVINTNNDNAQRDGTKAQPMRPTYSINFWPGFRAGVSSSIGSSWVSPVPAASPSWFSLLFSVVAGTDGVAGGSAPPMAVSWPSAGSCTTGSAIANQITARTGGRWERGGVITAARLSKGKLDELAQWV